MKIKKSMLFVILISIITIMSCTAIAAPPSIDSIPLIPTEFFGTATWYDLNSTQLSVGTRIDVFAYNVSCGTFYIQNYGYYGLLSCNSDDNSTNQTIEGAVQGQNILFYINNESTITEGDTVWYSGEFHCVNISPEPHCGNGHCELTESCINCAEDCGTCPPPEGGGGTGGGAEAPSGGGGGGGGGGGVGAEGVAGGAGISGPVCIEDWICSEWMPELCPVNQTQTRICLDRNGCGTNYTKPDETKECAYLGTCFDIMRNQDETDLDCGGLVCQPCDVGKHCFIDRDCKTGFCHPIEEICRIPTCYDGIQNQRETGIDCGGPCPPCRPQLPTLERPITILHFLVLGCGPFPWIFILMSSIVLLVFYLMGRYYIQSIEQSGKFKKLKRLEQLQKSYGLRKNLNMFTLIGIVLVIAVALYLYYLCQVIFWVFVLVIIIIPIVATILIKYLVYDEKRKEARLKALIITHEELLQRVIQLEVSELRKLKIILRPKLEKVLNTKKLPKKVNELLCSLRELIISVKESDIDKEQKIVDKVNELMRDENKKAMQSDVDLQEVYDSLVLIQKIYDDKLKMVDELKKDKDLEEQLDEQEDKDSRSSHEENISEDEGEKEKGMNQQQEDEFIKKEIETIKKQAQRQGSFLSKIFLPSKNDRSKEPQVIEEVAEIITDKRTGDENQENQLVKEFDKFSGGNSPEAKKPEVRANDMQGTEELDKDNLITSLKGTEKSKDMLAVSTHRVDILKVCKPENYFRLINGVILKNISELLEELYIMEDFVFYHHITGSRNDFANWIENVFNEKELALEIRKAKNKSEILSLLVGISK